MISKRVVCSDSFKSLSTGAQALFTQLVLEADDDGFVASVNGVITSNKKYKRSFFNELIDKRFVLAFDSGVCVIKHWLIMNSIRKDRYRQTVYQKELGMLDIEPNLAYTEKAKEYDFGNQMATKWQPMVATSKDKISKDKISKDKDLRERAGEDRIYQSLEEEKVVKRYQQFNPSWDLSVSKERLSSFLTKHTFEDFEEAMKRAAKSNYLTGKKGGPVMKLDWVLEEDNYLSVISGKYDSWEEEVEKAPRSFDASEFFERAVAKGRSNLGSYFKDDV